MAVLRLAWKSLLNRRSTALITILTIALSVALLLGVERLRHDARSGFANTISGTDLVVGARSGPTQLLLYAVFHIGNATNNISWKTYRELQQHPRIAWTVPISLGDSHAGYRVIGTTPAFYRHYQYADERSLEFARGAPFEDVFDVVLGSQVASKLGYRIGDRIVLAHGAGPVSLVKHEDKPFRVVGILAPSGTPVDRSLQVDLRGIEAIHKDWFSGSPIPGVRFDAERVRNMDLTPQTITAFLVGLNSKVATFRVQREINTYPEEPLLAVLPGAALAELWELMGVAENALLVISAMVVMVGLAGMLTVLLTSLNERRREMAILRSIGARPWQIFSLVIGEASVISLAGMLGGLLLLYLGMFGLRPWLASEFNLFIGLGPPGLRELALMLLVWICGTLIGLLPARAAYRNSLADGLTLRL
jgi:putative ABC transport system permease protein